MPRSADAHPALELDRLRHAAGATDLSAVRAALTAADPTIPVAASNRRSAGRRPPSNGSPGRPPAAPRGGRARDFAVRKRG